MTDPQLQAMRRAAQRAELRMRVRRVVALLPYASSAGLALGAGVIAARKLWPDDFAEGAARAALAAIAGAVVLALFAAALRRLPPRAGALALDAHHALRGRVTNALEFAETEPSRRAPMMVAAIAEACHVAPRLSARRAVRVPFPPEFAVSAAIGGAVVLLALLTERIAPPPPPPVEVAVAKANPLDMGVDDLNLFKNELDELAKEESNPELKAAIAEFNQLLEDIARKNLNREEAFRQMENIERQLENSAQERKKALEEALKETAKELKDSELAKPLAGSLEKKDLEKAKKDLQKMAKDLRNKAKPPKKEELERLKKALEQAAKNKEEALAKLDEVRDQLKKEIEEMEEDLLAKKRDRNCAPSKEELDQQELVAAKKSELDGLDRQREELVSLHRPDAGAGDADAGVAEVEPAAAEELAKLDKQREGLAAQVAGIEEELGKKKAERESRCSKEDQEHEEQLAKKKRELERLDRRREQTEQARRALSRLDRELAKAAEDLLRDLGLSADDLERAAEELNRMEQDQEMSEQQKEELRKRLEELRELIRQQGQGGKKMKARLAKFGKRARGGMPKPGSGAGQEGDEGQGLRKKPGQGEGEGEGEGEGDLTLGLGPGGVPIPGGNGEGEGAGEGEGDMPGGEGTEPGGKEWGHGHDPNLEGAETDPKGSTVDVRAEGLDSKTGPSTAQIIFSAAGRGFAGKPYAKVFRDYQNKVEEQIEQETIPDGYRFYVRRYFQLIRPRE